MIGFIVFIMACSDKVVSVYNQEPTISISSHADGDSISAGVVTTLQAVVGDRNHDLSLLNVRWLGPSGEICANTAPDASGESLCIYTPTQEDIWIRAQVVDPDGALDEDQVDFNVLSNTAPMISILTPQTNAQLTEGEMVLFQAMVSDAEDSPSALQYQWTSNLDGALPIVNSPSPNGLIDGFATLSLGTHVITLTVMDTGGLTDSEVVAVVVDTANTAPECDIISPVNQSIAIAGEDILFHASAMDAETEYGQLYVILASDIDGVLYTGTADETGHVQFPHALSAGQHTLTLLVEDDRGATCASEILVNVGTPPTLSIQNPLDGDSYDIGEAIVFQATVMDAEQAPENLHLSWSSDIDGVFSTQGADGTGSVSFMYDMLSEGSHVITGYVEDELGLSSNASLGVVIAPEFCNPNPAGTVNIPSSAYCDPNPPSGWTQCAGWINTAADDVSNSILDGCVNGNSRLRIRVWNQYTSILEEDVYSTSADVSLWRPWDYLGGSVTKEVYTHWTGNTTYFTTTGGGSACYFNNNCGIDAPCGTMTLGTGNGSSMILAPGWDNEYELRVNCSGSSLPDRIIAVYY